MELNFEEAKENYRNFYQSVKGITANEYMNSIHRIITTKGKLIEIISLNTCILQQNKEHFRGMGFVGNDQLEAIRKELKLTDKINPYRIIVMHHNLLPALYSEMPVINPMYSIMLDSEAITQFRWSYMDTYTKDFIRKLCVQFPQRRQKKSLLQLLV